jgi:hypothetical protein
VESNVPKIYFSKLFLEEKIEKSMDTSMGIKKKPK